MTTDFSLPADSQVGQVHLRVRDLNAALQFYVDILGFQEVRREGAAVLLSATGQPPYHFILTGKPDATPHPRRAPGLFHVAVRYPNRRALAQTLKHLGETQWPIGGASDHLVSEAIYLSDSEGNGVELYADRPRAQWPREDGQIGMATEPLDLYDLMSEVAGDQQPWSGTDPATDIGHVHLQVSDLAAAERFYHDLIGLDVTQRTYPGALFFSAGGYHHHVGTNIWNSRGAKPAPADAAGLVSWSLFIPEVSAWQQVLERLQAAGNPVQLMGYPTSDPTAGVLVRDHDEIGLELQTLRTAIQPETLAELARTE